MDRDVAIGVLLTRAKAAVSALDRADRVLCREFNEEEEGVLGRVRVSLEIAWRGAERFEDAVRSLYGR